MNSPLETTREIYDRITIRLHWATALLVAIQWLMGRTINFLPRGPFRVDLWSVHIVFGLALAGVLLARIFWRAFYGRRLPPADRGALQVLAKSVHWLLYLLLLTVVTLGVINVFAHAFPWFNVWHFPRLGDEDFMHAINNWHGFFANALAAVAVLHAAAALVHHYLMRDAVLRRMWPRVRLPGR